MTGAAGAYTLSFESMEESINNVKNVINSASVSVDELAGYQSDIDDISNRLSGTQERMRDLDTSFSDIKHSISQGQFNLTELRKDADRLQQSASDVRDQATKLQEANVHGALVLTKEAKLRSDNAADRVAKVTKDSEDSDLARSSQQREATDRLISEKGDTIESTQVNNTNALKEIAQQIDLLQVKMPGLNKVVCDGETSLDAPCDALCGGAGCGKCGGLSCQQGALTKAEEALQNTKEAERILAEKDLEAESALNKVSSVYSDVSAAEGEAQLAYNLASEAKSRSLNEVEDVNQLSTRIDNFLKDDKATPEQVKNVAYECLNATMTMGTDQIKSLAEDINQAIASVTDVEKINAETEAPLAQARQLKADAELANKEASAKLATAENVVKFLASSEDAQNIAEEAIASAQRDIDAARRDLGTIQSEMETASRLSEETIRKTESLVAEQKSLQTVYITNEKDVKSAGTAAEAAREKAQNANSALQQLNLDFIKVSDSLDDKSRNIGSAKDRAMDLQRRANKLANSASSKLANLEDMEKEYEENQRQLDLLSSQLTQINCKMQIHLTEIEEKANFYRTCSSPSVFQPSQLCQCSPGASDPVCVQTASPARY